jgi:hypothetical protein
VGCDVCGHHLPGREADLRLLTERVAGSVVTRTEPRAPSARAVVGSAIAWW